MRTAHPAFRPVKIARLELAGPLHHLEGVGGYGSAQVFVSVHGNLIGSVRVPVVSDRCSKTEIRRAILRELHEPLIRTLVCHRLRSPVPAGGLRLPDLLGSREREPLKEGPLVTVAVCTKDRPEDLTRCLGALLEVEHSPVDVLVVDNAPSTDATARLVREQFTGRVRYVHETRPGLDWARNRAITECRGAILAFTDDDVVVDSGWVSALVQAFAEEPDVMAVTGLVLPHELETEAQAWFEEYGGFSKGFRRQWHRVPLAEKGTWMFHLRAGRFGTGANMAFRREVFDRIGGFDPALDVGTATDGGGDLEMFFRVLQEGFALLYEPGAVVWHRHRRTLPELHRQIGGWGTGLKAHLTRTAVAYPALRGAVVRFYFSHLWSRYGRPLLLQRRGQARYLRRLRWIELPGAILGPLRYWQARRTAERIRRACGGGAFDHGSRGQRAAPAGRVTSKGFGIKTVELSTWIQPIEDVTAYARVRVFVAWQGRLLGHVDIANHGMHISAARLREEIVERFAMELLDSGGARSRAQMRAHAEELLSAWLNGSVGERPGTRPIRSRSDTVSIVVATHDRPEHLRTCLRSLVEQSTGRRIEIIVVDNHPASGLTRSVVAEFPNVLLVEEPRKGSSYARNAGILVSGGELIVTTDDDVVASACWLEKLLAPFRRPEVMVTTGQILPRELETQAQILFETYGGLGRGYAGLDVGEEWFESYKDVPVPTWLLGATANAAFRAAIFRDPAIGLFEETLGAGMPTGVGEDTYQFYKVLRAGHRIVYQPDAYVWHAHRRDMVSLRRQLFNYSKGHVAYLLVTWSRDGDRRALSRLCFELPWWHVRRLRARLLRRTAYSLALLAVEIAGNCVGPLALLRARGRVAREGRSGGILMVEPRAESTSLTHGLPSVVAGRVDCGGP